jgi:hypothetical protein
MALSQAIPGSLLIFFGEYVMPRNLLDPRKYPALPASPAVEPLIQNFLTRGAWLRKGAALSGKYR